MFDRRTFLASSAAAAALSAGGARAVGIATETIRVDTRAVTGKLPHVWEESVGSDRAAITLREEWRQDMRIGHAEAGFKRARFHGIFNDELGVFGKSILEMRRNGGPNWLNVHRVYDGLLDIGVSPYVELSFMPGKLASGKTQFGFYGANITPPNSDAEFAGFIKSFTAAMVDRYGIETVRTWPFEVWNEPNLSFFWTGDKQRYFDMYKAAAVAIKSVDPRIQVGGPATSRTAWIGDFAQWCAANNAPVDFFATHVYAGDDQNEVFGKDAPRRGINDVIPDALANARRTIDSGPFSGKALWLSEWSSDSPAMIAHVIAQGLAHCAGMSQWTLSGMYEELGVDDYMLKEGSMGWSMMIDGIAKPSFNAYRLLHRLGTERLSAQGPVLASRGKDGRISVLVWNLAEVDQPGGIPGMTSERKIRGEAKRIVLKLDGIAGRKAAEVRYVDWERGSPMPTWRAMGSPQYPSRDQVVHLRRASQPVVERRRLDGDGTLILDLPSEGLALVELI
ncbi:GH39 family glycosyl hydrolase [Novosphingobium sp.]|jgi:xylan 1,4-beta-xylosidase|uniref:GH39 family glycosyl hydrolase n=1 Tax=Novosphingobium sp. TaxID=1874826 RepID=UPI002FE1D1E7